MQFTTRFLAIAAAISQVLATPTLTNSNYNVVEGTTFDITWSGATGAVTLTLKDGASNDLKTVTTIASGLTGESFSWTPSGLPSDTYAIAITDSTGTNYSPQFSYLGTGTVSTTLSTTTTKASTTAASTTSDASSSKPTSTETTTSASSASASATGSANSTTSATSTSKTTSTSGSTTSSATSTNTPVNTNNGQKLGSSLAFIVLTAAALVVCH